MIYDCAHKGCMLAAHDSDFAHSTKLALVDRKGVIRVDTQSDVGIVAIQTTFEGFSANTLDRAREVAKRYDLDIPIGQSGSAAERSVFM